MTVEEALNELAKDCVTTSEVKQKLIDAGCTMTMVRGDTCTTCPVAQYLVKKTGKKTIVTFYGAHNFGDTEYLLPEIVEKFVWTVELSLA